jgi:hypothetical protein
MTEAMDSWKPKSKDSSITAIVKPAAANDTAFDVETPSDSALATLIPTSKVIEVKAPTPAPVVKYHKAIKRTLWEIVNKAFPKLSNTAKDAIMASLESNNDVLVLVNDNIEQVVEAKLKELGSIGFIITIDQESPIDLSHRFKYIAYQGRDSLIRVKQSWENTKKTK